MLKSKNITRRQFSGQLSAVTFGALAHGEENVSLRNEVGVTTGSFTKHLAADRAEGKLRLLDLPAIMRDELGMKVIDLMTATLASTTPAYLEELRAKADAAGCVLTNLKMNQPGIDMCSEDEAAQRHALDEYKRTIDAAARLGVRWVRPLPGRKKPDMALLTKSYRELIDYAAPRGIELLVENYGWMQDQPDAIPRIVAAVGAGIHAQPDTGNWTDAARDTGLANAFPLAATCDFKAFEFDESGGHPKYDLKHCFEIGWRAGFRGPWCIEHFAPDLKRLLREMVWLKEKLLGWMLAG